MLYTVGDSFTYGQELYNPEQQAWPVLLADRLGYRLINDGRPGVGNEYIVKQIAKVGDLFKDYSFDLEEEKEIIDFIADNCNKFREVSLRMALKVADLKNISPNNWRALAESTCMKRV